MSAALPNDLRLRQGERLVLADRESRLLRGLADGFVCVVSIAIGVAFNAIVMGGDGNAGLSVLITIGLTLAPVFIFMSSRPLAHVLLTNQRLLVGPHPQDLDSADYLQIQGTTRWLATLFVRLKDGTTLAIGNMRGLYAIEREITRRRQV